MKVIVSESLGAGYTSNIISSCNDAGVQAIADYNGNEILFYDPVNKLFARHSDIIKNMDIEIFDMFREKRKKDDDGKIGLELRKEVMKPTEGEDFEKFATEWDALQRQESPDILKTKNCSMIRFGANEASISDGGMDDNISEWYAERFPDDDLAGRINTQVTFQDAMDCIDYGADIYDLLGTFDSTIRERLFAELAARTGIEYGKLYRKWLKNSAFDESIDNGNDWSASEGEVEIMWTVDYPEFGIEAGNTDNFVVEYDNVALDNEYDIENNGLRDEICRLISDEYPGLDFEPYDFDIMNEREFWGIREQDRAYPYDESGSSKGGTIDVTIKFTHGHYGKKLKSGEEKTIKLDTSTAPTIYDADDMLTWIADVASDQIPGGGKVTKYDFETVDPPDDVLIKAVMGDEGFGPDVDVDFEDFDPEDVPSEISYRDALKFYQKMREAYDERKLNYTKYDQIRNKLMDAIVKGLLKEKSLDELAEEWFKDYGTMNGWGWKTSFKYNVAGALHKLHKAKHPDEHARVPQKNHWRGWHEDYCSCGFGSSSDSSD